jgi:ABC-type nitrate/sulfonate/bicarbonate transport system substrate-binding protein
VDELNRVKGWTGDDRAVKVTVGGATSSELAALKTGEVDATIVSRQVGFLVEEQQVGRFLFDASAYIGPIEMNTIFAHKTLVEKNPDAVRRFLKGWYETVAYMKAHKDETVEIGSKVMGDPPIVVSRAYDTLIAKFSNDGKFTPAALETLRGSFVALKSVNGPIDMSKLYTEKYLPAAG